MNLGFKQFLKEQQSDTMVFAFGRYNPPTKGHVLHFEAIDKYARQNGMPYEIFISKTVDHKKNPVPVADRIAYIQKALPELYNISPAVNMFTIVEQLASEGKKKLVYLAGSDYFDSGPEQSMLKRLESFAAEQGATLTVQMSRQREPQSEISGSVLRKAALSNNFNTFLKASPVGMGSITEKDVAHMFELTKQGLQAQKG